MADSDLQVFELGRDLQLRLKIEWLLFLFPGDVLAGGITTLRGQRTEVERWIPYGRVITRGPGTFGFQSAAGEGGFG